ncbi:MAG: WYL domain-containing protein, partial [Bacteroidetes bacterium]
IDKVSDALDEYEGIDKGISKRTIQLDLQFMRSDKLGYNTPIIVVDRKFYTYEDPDYSITNLPLSQQDLSQLNDAVELLKQFHGFTHFRDLDGMVQKLEDHVSSQKEMRSPIIHFDKNEHLKGLQFIDEIYKAILKKKVLQLTYQSFKARQPGEIILHAYLLKEYNNRWFVVGQSESHPKLLTLALDRMVSINTLETIPFKHYNTFNPDTFYKDIIGVTVNTGDPVETVELFVKRRNAPYVITKPLHHSQEILSKSKEGILIRIHVKLNYELEREILGFGESIIVMKPEGLKQRITQRLTQGVKNYTESGE